MLSYLAEVLGFVFLLACIYRYVRPPLRKLMDRQAESIRKSLSSADDAVESGERMIAEAHAALEAAHSDAAGIIDRANQISAQIVLEAELRGREEHERLVTGAAVVADFESQRARGEVTQEIGSVVVAATELVVAAEMNASLQREFIGKAIDAAEAMA